MVETSLEAVAACGASLLSGAFAPVPSPSDRGFLNSSPPRLADNNPPPGLRTRICKSLPETVEFLPLRFCRSCPHSARPLQLRGIRPMPLHRPTPAPAHQD